MPGADRLAAPKSPLLTILRADLSPRPGRVAAVARIAGSCTVIVALSMLYEIPLPAYMAYVVFLLSREDQAATLQFGIVAGLAVTVAIALSLLFYTLDAAEPALRLPLMALSAFVGMYLTRIMALGPVAFLVGYVLVQSQTMIDRIPNVEALTHLILWLWVVAIVPDIWTVFVNLAMGENPSHLARRTAIRLLDGLAAALRSGDLERRQTLLTDAVGLVELRQRAGMLDKSLRGKAALDNAAIEALAEMLTLLTLLPPDTPLDARAPLAENVDACVVALDRNRAPVLRMIPAGETETIIVAMHAVIARLGHDLAARSTAVESPATPTLKAAFAPDAFTNPRHVRFALKTTFAVMAAYIIDNALDWPGISTAVTTCFFVALGSFGETMHKLTLRIAGAVIGGLAAGLCMVFVLPRMSDIGHLCLLIAAASWICAWVSTSGDRLSYAGLQMAFAFFLGVLQGYGPADDLTVLRDRIAGILLGNLLMTLVFSVLWPVSAVELARESVAKAVRMLGPVLSKDPSTGLGGRLAVLRAVGAARRYVSLAVFEGGVVSRRRFNPQILSVLDRLTAAVFAVADQPGTGQPGDDGARSHDQAVAAWLMRLADTLEQGQVPPVIPAFSPDAFSQASPSAIEARLLLQTELDNAAFAQS